MENIKPGWVAVNDLFTELREAIETTYDVGRERSLALTKLEEAELWLRKAGLF